MDNISILSYIVILRAHDNRIVVVLQLSSYHLHIISGAFAYNFYEGKHLKELCAYLSNKFQVMYAIAQRIEGEEEGAFDLHRKHLLRARSTTSLIFIL